MPFKVVIPARFDSSRFPGKVLANINGKPMIQHVYERACQSQADEVIIATDTQRVGDLASRFQAKICITGLEHTSGTDRVREVAEQLEWPEDTVVVNVQGDSPLISPVSIDQVGTMLVQSPGVDIGTLRTPIETKEEFFNSNVVKVVCNALGQALYFSRAPIPWQNGDWVDNAYRHLGIYGYRVATLKRFTEMGPSALESIECLEQLRALTVGMYIKVITAKEPHLVDVDTPEDLEAVEQLLQ